MAKGDSEKLRADTDDGYSRVSVVLQEALACAPLSSTEMRIVMYIMRRTYGWAKTDDRDTGRYCLVVSRELAKAIGITHRMAEAGLRGLYEAGVLLRGQPLPGGPFCYGMNCDVEVWGNGSPAWGSYRGTLLDAHQYGAFSPGPELNVQMLPSYTVDDTRLHNRCNRGTCKTGEGVTPEMQGGVTPEVQLVQAVSPTGTGADDTLTAIITETLTENNNTDSAPDGGADDSTPESGRIDTPEQSAIRECWEALGCPGTPGGKSYSRWMQLLQENGIPTFLEWAAYLRLDPNRSVPDGAKPGSYFNTQLKEAMQAKFVWRKAPRLQAASLSEPLFDCGGTLKRASELRGEDAEYRWPSTAVAAARKCFAAGQWDQAKGRAAEGTDLRDYYPGGPLA